MRTKKAEALALAKLIVKNARNGYPADPRDALELAELVLALEAKEAA